MSVVSSNNFIKNTADYLTIAAKENKEMLVKTTVGNVVVLSEKKYRSLVETAYLNGIPGMAEDLIEGMNTPLDECISIEWDNV